MNIHVDRKTVPVPACDLSDAALMADYRASRNRLSLEELAEVMCGASLELTAKEEAAANRATTRLARRSGKGA